MIQTRTETDLFWMVKCMHGMGESKYRVLRHRVFESTKSISSFLFSETHPNCCRFLVVLFVCLFVFVVVFFWGGEWDGGWGWGVSLISFLEQVILIGTTIILYHYKIVVFFSSNGLVHKQHLYWNTHQTTKFSSKSVLIAHFLLQQGCWFT